MVQAETSVMVLDNHIGLKRDMTEGSDNSFHEITGNDESLCNGNLPIIFRIVNESKRVKTVLPRTPIIL